ncbi:MAG: hypothetical protein KJ950_01355 [Proteobacteria bacterium]|nr:hypothetical protein [Pseudomonadota bacterium]MBU1686304.1 hypothetical protein [Pseudomonadota bacterium]
MIKYFLIFSLFLPTSVYAVDPSINTGCDYGVILSSSSASWQWGSSTYYCSILYNCDGSYTLGPAACRPYAYDARVLDFQCTSSGWSLISDRGADDHFKDIYANGGGNWIWRDYSHANDSVLDIQALLPECNNVQPDPCPDETQAAINACKGSNNVANWPDSETCGGWFCKTCETIREEKIFECNPQEFSQYMCEQDFLINPTELTFENPGICGPSCYQREKDFFELNCKPIGENLKSFNCDTNQGECTKALVDCNEEMQSCVIDCGGVIKNFDCKNGIILKPCECFEGITDNSKPPSSPDEHGTPDDNPNNSDPNDSDSQSFGKIIDNTASIVSNTAKIQTTLDDELNEANDTLDNINTGIVAINTTLSDTDFKETDSENKYKYEDVPGTYASPINDASQYSTRFTTFVDDIKSTPLFSLPNQILFNIPNSTESSYTVNMGSYGDFDFDLADYSTVLIVLRSVFLICFSFVAIRIVLLKG